MLHLFVSICFIWERTSSMLEVLSFFQELLCRHLQKKAKMGAPGHWARCTLYIYYHKLHERELVSTRQKISFSGCGSTLQWHIKADGQKQGRTDCFHSHPAAATGRWHKWWTRVSATFLRVIFCGAHDSKPASQTYFSQLCFCPFNVFNSSSLSPSCHDSYNQIRQKCVGYCEKDTKLKSERLLGKGCKDWGLSVTPRKFIQVRSTQIWAAHLGILPPKIFQLLANNWTVVTFKVCFYTKQEPQKWAGLHVKP